MLLHLAAQREPIAVAEQVGDAKREVGQSVLLVEEFHIRAAALDAKPVDTVDRDQPLQFLIGGQRGAELQLDVGLCRLVPLGREQFELLDSGYDDCLRFGCIEAQFRGIEGEVHPCLRLKPFQLRKGEAKNGRLVGRLNYKMGRSPLHVTMQQCCIDLRRFDRFAEGDCPLGPHIPYIVRIDPHACDL